MSKHYFYQLIIFFIFSLVLLHLLANGGLAQSNNSISGIVFGDSNRPVGNIYVELLTDTYSTIKQVRSSNAGFFSFRGLSSGYYIVKVLPYGTNYQEQMQSVSLIPVSATAGSGAISEQVNFYLKLKNDSKSESLTAPGVVFAQNVPKEAELLYAKGIELLEADKVTEGLNKIKESIEVFPEYYLALDRLGNEYVKRENYRPAYVLLLKSLEINPKSFSSRFGFGVTQFKLNQIKESIKTLKLANEIFSGSPNAQMWLGIVLHQNGDLAEAETALEKANKLSNEKSAVVHWQLARLYNSQKRFKESANELELYLKYNPDVDNVDSVKKSIEKLKAKRD